MNRAVAKFNCIDQVPIHTKVDTGTLCSSWTKSLTCLGEILSCIMKSHLCTEIRTFIQAKLACQPFFACNIDIRTSRAVDVCMADTESLETQSVFGIITDSASKKKKFSKLYLDTMFWPLPSWLWAWIQALTMSHACTGPGKLRLPFPGQVQ